MLGLAVLALTFASGPQTPAQVKPGQTRDLPPFLDDFKGAKEVPVVGQDVSFAGSSGRVHGYWARPDNRQPLPAVLLVYAEESWTDWMKDDARKLSSIGYGVLAVDIHRRRPAGAGATEFTDGPALADLSAAVRWLRSRGDVLPQRVGAVGWHWAGGQVLALGAAASLQACITCDGPIPDEAGLILGLRGTPLLGVFSGDDKAAQQALPSFRKALAAAAIPCKFHIAEGTRAGFMGPPGQKGYAHEAAEKAWIEIYEFLGKHVEDARPLAAGGEAVKSVATVADIMRAVNEPAGVRGTLSRALEQEPATAQQWGRIRAGAALIAEAGVWLQGRTPHKGSQSHWKDQAKAFTATAQAIANAADARDYPAARRGLQDLAGKCAACHEQHR
jgi:dienelactone hydrolase